MTKANNQEFRLAFKCQNKHISFLAISRSPRAINVVESGLAMRNAFDASDVHITYPANGKVHYTIRKDKVYAAHIYRRATTITCYTSSHDPADLPDYNAIAAKILPLKSMVKDGPLLDEFSANDVYIFPTVAFTVNPESAAESFDKRTLKQKYGEPIDLTETQDHNVNVHIVLAGSMDALQGVSFDFPNAVILKRATIGTSPVICVVVTMSPNEA